MISWIRLDMRVSLNYSIDGSARRTAFNQICKDDLPVVCLYNVASAHVMSPVVPFDQDLGQNLGNQLARFVIIENDNEIDSLKRR